MTTATEAFRRARDFLLEHREDYATAHRDFAWPRPDRFNWALDWFDVIADGNDRTALHLVEEDGDETRLSFADLARRSDQVANWLRQRGVAAEDRVLVMLGNQAAVLKGAPHPNAGKLLIEFLLSKEGADVVVQGEAVYTFLKGYKPPEGAKPYLLDLNEHKLLGLDDWVAAQGQFKTVRDEWLERFR